MNRTQHDLKRASELALPGLSLCTNALFSFLPICNISFFPRFVNHFVRQFFSAPDWIRLLHPGFVLQMLVYPIYKVDYLSSALSAIKSKGILGTVFGVNGNIL